jgi:hypothetical protein
VAYSREVPGYNLDQDSDYTDGDISWFCWALPIECRMLPKTSHNHFSIFANPLFPYHRRPRSPVLVLNNWRL